MCAISAFVGVRRLCRFGLYLYPGVYYGTIDTNKRYILNGLVAGVEMAEIKAKCF